MIKKTLYFGNPAYLSLHLGQLVIKLPEIMNGNPSCNSNKAQRTIPIEDIGIIVLDNKQITITNGLIEVLVKNQVAIVSCDSHSMPSGLFLPLTGNSTFNEHFRHQIECSIPLKKQLWQQTIKAKIQNQALCLQKHTKNSIEPLLSMVRKVKSGDTDNCEAQAAVYYWKNLFPNISHFVRDRNGQPPNNLLNYGYAILRSIVARNLIISGLLPIYGIHHHNKYNEYCLADDVMEPYRPYIDDLVITIMKENKNCDTLSKDIKSVLLTIPTIDVTINEKRSPLIVAVGTTTASLAKCFKGSIRKIEYPMFI